MVKANDDVLILLELSQITSENRTTMEETTFAGSYIYFSDSDLFSEKDDDDFDACDNTKSVTVSLCSLLQNDRTEHKQSGSNHEDDDSCYDWSNCSSVTLDTILYDDFEQTPLLSVQPEETEEQQQDLIHTMEDCCNVANLHFRSDNFRKSDIVRSTTNNAPKLPKRRKSIDDPLLLMMWQHSPLQSPCSFVSKQ